MLNLRSRKSIAPNATSAKAEADRPLLVLSGVSRRYGARTVLNDITLSLTGGESVILRGGNGSGKSTLLKLAAGMIPSSSGEVVRQRDLSIGFAPDRLPKLRMTSEEYLTHMGRIAGMAKAPLAQRIEELHELLELPAGNASMLLHYSKGMLQKVNLMQALLNEPKLLLLDEPFSGLDSESSARLLKLLHGLRAEGAAVITALHDPLPSWESVSLTYRLREGRLVPEKNRAADDVRIAAYYELDGLLPETGRAALAAEFPAVLWTAAGSVLRCGIPDTACEDFMRGFWAAGGTLLSLRREEGTP
ncbi:ABC transporter [Saccharibacillus sp. O23]|uniref:ATP-binding cassette domain-containing protein n=1 Tax=Saccharibacillus sp. O23 TaxID=2009338 RepID=UPI000B4E3299|nr:ATP-binding cassette domain-containing protein [Saccharibacillus sp. O23]OWR29444.1 ABC transporter [Saccharibacillus sp. O23]